MHMAKGTIVSVFTVLSVCLCHVPMKGSNLCSHTEEAGVDLGGGGGGVTIYIYIYIYIYSYTYIYIYTHIHTCNNYEPTTNRPKRRRIPPSFHTHPEKHEDASGWLSVPTLSMR